MRIIVSDTSCVIDLRKGQLLEVLFELPYTIAMAQPLFDDELLSLGQQEKRLLKRKGLEVVDLDGPSVMTAQRYFNQNKSVSLNDCFALVVAEQHGDSILLTADRNLSTLATGREVETHGVLWATDEMYAHGCCEPVALRAALKIFLEDPLIFLPEQLIRPRLRRYR